MGPGRPSGPMYLSAPHYQIWPCARAGARNASGCCVTVIIVGDARGVGALVRGAATERHSRRHVGHDEANALSGL